MKIKKKSLSHWKYFWPGCLQPFGCRLFFVSLCPLPPAHCCPLCPLHDTQLVTEASSWTVFVFFLPPQKNHEPQWPVEVYFTRARLIYDLSYQCWHLRVLVSDNIGSVRQISHMRIVVTACPNEHLWNLFQFVFSYFLKCIPPTHINDDDDFSLCFSK